MRNRLFMTFTVFLLATIIATAGAGETPGKSAAKPGFPSFGTPKNQAFGNSRDEKVTVSAKIARETIPQGSQQIIAIILDIADSWHIWTDARETPEGFATFEGAQYTAITITAQPTGVIADDIAIQWPDFHGTTADLGSGPEKYAVFEGRSIAYIVVSIPENAPLGNVTFTAEVYLQACGGNPTTCLMPETIAKTLSFEIVAANSDTPIDSGIDDPDFAGFDSSQLTTVEPDVSHSEQDGPAPAVQTAPPTAELSAPTFFGIKLPRAEGPVGVLLVALMALIGGFVLNLTPCVLPVIPIKIMTITHHAGSPHRSMMLGLWMALGVITFWVGIGIPVAMFRSITDPSRIFGIWWFTLGIGALIGLMGIGIMGLFTIRLPQTVYAINPKADTPGGSFIFGIMTAVLGLPCFGFVAGALLAGTAKLPAIMILTIFTCLGIGMALPYFVLSAKPSLVDKFPRTGPGSELVKQVMGLLLLAAAAYFVGAGLIALNLDHPYLAKQLHWWVVALFAVLAGAWLLIRTIQITPKFGPRISFTLIGLLIGGLAVAFAADSTAKARSQWLIKRDAMAGSNNSSYINGIWNDYSPQAVAQARHDGKIVVLDFTATWCINCEVLKATVLDRNPVKSEFNKEDIITFLVDNTSSNAPGWDLMAEIGQTGIPLLLIYTPGEDIPWQSNAYTSKQVVNALTKARSNSAIALR